MLRDWQTLFAPRPLATRALCLQLDGLAFPLWFASTDAADLKEVLPVDFLTAAEQARAGEFKFGQPRENFTLGRLAGKLALTGAMDARPPQTPGLSPDGTAGEALERKLRAFDIHNGERGEPLVRAGDDKLPTLAVSLSHVNGLGTAVAFPAGERVGMDLELIDAQRAETVRRGVPLSVEEEAWLRITSLPEATALLLLWTAREALGKALGCGLACQWETLALREIEAAGDGVWRGRFRHHPEFSCLCWVGPAAVISTAFTAR